MEYTRSEECLPASPLSPRIKLGDHPLSKQTDSLVA